MSLTQAMHMASRVKEFSCLVTFAWHQSANLVSLPKEARASDAKTFESLRGYGMMDAIVRHG